MKNLMFITLSFVLCNAITLASDQNNFKYTVTYAAKGDGSKPKRCLTVENDNQNNSMPTYPHHRNKNEQEYFEESIFLFRIKRKDMH